MIKNACGWGVVALFFLRGVTGQGAAPAIARGGATSPNIFRLQLEGKNERLVADAQINSHPATVAFDTGMAVPFLVFSHALSRLEAEAASPTVDTAAPIPGKAAMGVSSPLDFAGLGVTATETPAFVAEFPLYVQAEQQSDAMLGWPALRENILEFSLGAQRPAVRALRSFPKLSGGLALAVMNTPQLTLRFSPDRPNLPRLVIDTGNPGGVFLRTDRWQSWRLAHQHDPRTLEGSIMFGQRILGEEIMWADEIKIGSLTLRGVPVARAEAAYNTSIKPGEDFVVMGLAALKRVVLVVDARSGRGAIAANPAPSVPYIQNRIGAVFLPRDDSSEDLVARVAAHGPAAAVGIRNGDVLLKVNGGTLAGWRQNTALLRRMFWEDPHLTTVTLTLRRGESTFDQVVTAQKILGPAAPAPPTHRGEPPGEKQERALAGIQAPLKIDFEAAEVFGVLASILDANGDGDGAIETYDHAIAASPQDPQAVFQRGIYKARHGDVEGGLADFDRALELSPRDYNIYNARAALKSAAGDSAGAIRDYSQAVTLSPEVAELYFNRAMLEEQTGANTESEQDFDRAATLDPEGEAEAFSGRGRMKKLRGDAMGAVQDGNHATALHLLQRARSNYENNHRAEALASLDQALALDPRNALIYRERFNIRMEEGDTAGGAADAQQYKMLSGKRLAGF